MPPPKKGYSPNGELKRCRGPLHREGVMLPIARFTKNNGTLMSQCRQCIQHHRGADPENVLVPYKFVEPVVTFLSDWLGSKAEVSRRLGWHRSYLSTKRDDMQGVKFQELMGLCREVQQELGIRYVTQNAEPTVVASEPLGEILRQWREKWLRDQGYEKDVYEMVEYGANAYLHEKTGINLRTVGRILNSELDFIGETKADSLLAAIHKQELIDLGEIPVLPNPSWSPTAYVDYLQASGVM